MRIFEKINDKKLAGSNSILAGVPPDELSNGSKRVRQYRYVKQNSLLLKLNFSDRSRGFS
jgi:hypothetical protein